jgi:hypothetical protein
MKQLSPLAIFPIMIVLGAGEALAAGPSDPFDTADAMVNMCSGIFRIAAVLIAIGFMIIVLAKRRQDKRNK